MKAGAAVVEAGAGLECGGGGGGGGGAALLLVRLAAAERRCRFAVAWPFYAEARELEACGFLRVDDLPLLRESEPLLQAGAGGGCGRCAALVAARRHAGRARSLAACARSHGLLVQVVEGEPLRLLSAAVNYSVLFLEEALWGEADAVHAVQPPPCACALRFRAPVEVSGDDTLLSLFAPPVFDAVTLFEPSASDVREVLRYSDTGDDIEESACRWTLENPQKLNFSNATSAVRYQIRLYLCSEDPDGGEYEQISKHLVGTLLPDGLPVAVTPTRVKCASGDALLGELSKNLHKVQEQRTVGWLAPSAGSEKLQNLLENLSLPLVAYGAPAGGLRPNRVVRAAAGSVRALGRALARLLALGGVRRLAVLAERAPLADELAAVLREDRHLIVRRRNVSSADGDVAAALREFRDAGARVFFVNGGAEVCARVLCAAAAERMAAEEDYLWIVREWRGPGGCGTRAPRPLAVGLAWRGSLGAEGWAGGGGRAARELDARWNGTAWPPLAAPLADALLLLAGTLAGFLRRHPESAYDRHVFGNAGNFANALNETRLSGITEELSYNSETYELESALVFVERWERWERWAPGARRTLLAVWRVRGRGVRVLFEPGPLYSHAFGSGPSCYTTTSGDPFAPKCHDNVWLTSLVILTLAPVALLLARRARLRRLKLRDLALLEQLLEQRKTNSSRFGSCLVSRSEFELREELGAGAYGRVRAAVLRRAGLPALAVAAKEPAEERLQDEADLIREASVLFSLKHENIVSFVGVCLDGRAVFFMEYAFFGDLRHYLRARRPLAECAGAAVGAEAGAAVGAEAGSVSAGALTSLARDAAAALHYLALRRIVHRDVRAANCLVDETRRLKLADFGLARHLADEEEEYTWQNLRRLPAACMAPESLLHGMFSAASDVWALGVLILELVTLGEPPYGRLGTAAIAERVRAGRCPPLPRDLAPPTLELLEWCWRHSPHDRPSAAQVLGALRWCPPALVPALGPAPHPAPGTPPPGGRTR